MNVRKHESKTNQCDLTHRLPPNGPSEASLCIHMLCAIFFQGLKCMGRNHIHFATGEPEIAGVKSGRLSISCRTVILVL